MAALNRRLRGANAAFKPSKADKADFPRLLEEIMPFTDAETGETEPGSTITIFVMDGIIRVVIKDRSQGVSAFADLSGIADISGSLEGLLSGDTLRWKQDSNAPPAKKKKR